MKTSKYIIIALAALSMTACDFFESESPSAMDAAAVFSNENNTELAIAAIYEQFGQDKSYRNRLACGYQGMNTDAEFGTKNSGAADYNIYAITPNSSDLSTANGKDPWGYLNSAIERCNNAIEGIEQYGDTTLKSMKYYLGEVYFLRSFCYLELVKLWGDVPARFESIAKNEDGLTLKKSDRTNVLKQLRIDLKKAAEYMPWSKDCPGTTANYTGRPSKAAALALLARVDLMYAGKGVRPATWQSGPEFLVSDPSLRAELNTEVMWACAQILNESAEQGKFQDNYIDIFKKVWYNNNVMDMQEKILYLVEFLDKVRTTIYRQTMFAEFERYIYAMNENDAKGLWIEMDYDDGQMVYEIEFNAGNKEYNYEISATTGKVVNSEVEYDDDYVVSKPSTSTQQSKPQETTKPSTVNEKLK